MFMVLAALTDTILKHSVFNYFRLNQQYLKKKASFEATQGSENRIMGGLFPPQFPYISYVFTVRLLRLATAPI